MISRVAESCFWLHRYLERTENTARFLQVNQHVSLDIELPEADLWRPVLVVAGEEARYAATQGERIDGDGVQEFMTWAADNPASLVGSLAQARENARTIRETISLEMWQAVNTAWLWLGSREGKRLYERDRHHFYERVKSGCWLFHGLYHTTMLFDEPYDFMRLGSLLERADHTLRLLRATWEATAERARAADRPTDAPRWLATLRACSGVEPFVKRTRGTLVGSVVAGFLLHDDRFPRAVAHCLKRAELFLDRARGGADAPVGARARAALGDYWGRVHEVDIEARDFPAQLTALLDANARLGQVLHEEFFDVTAQTGTA
ncbi:MAG TPA: alpha-E domain-containing protein [Gemmatimonadales bacterium]|nr:alpha-E domain-containing protein [Gemmatimonadales bacterium]